MTFILLLKSSPINYITNRQLTERGKSDEILCENKFENNRDENISIVGFSKFTFLNITEKSARVSRNPRVIFTEPSQGSAEHGFENVAVDESTIDEKRPIQFWIENPYRARTLSDWVPVSVSLVFRKAVHPSVMATIKNVKFYISQRVDFSNKNKHLRSNRICPCFVARL